MAAKHPKSASDSPTIENRRARHDYTILDTLECGIVLSGSEVKSVRHGQVSLAEGYVRAHDNPPALLLHNIDIGVYRPAGVLGHASKRARTLLARKREILKFFRAAQGKGMTLVPLKMYFNRGWAKVLIGLAQGKGQSDKRDSIAEREMKRDMDRAMVRKIQRG